MTRTALVLGLSLSLLSSLALARSGGPNDQKGWQRALNTLPSIEMSAPRDSRPPHTYGPEDQKEWRKALDRSVGINLGSTLDPHPPGWGDPEILPGYFADGDTLRDWRGNVTWLLVVPGATKAIVSRVVIHRIAVYLIIPDPPESLAGSLEYGDSILFTCVIDNSLLPVSIKSSAFANEYPGSLDLESAAVFVATVSSIRETHDGIQW